MVMNTSVFRAEKEYEASFYQIAHVARAAVTRESRNKSQPGPRPRTRRADTQPAELTPTANLRPFSSCPP